VLFRSPAALRGEQIAATASDGDRLTLETAFERLLSRVE
jgi:hypothetical protein